METDQNRDTREADRQKTRIRMTWVSTSNYVAATVGLALYSLVGTLPWWVPALYFAFTMAGSGVFLAMLYAGINQRLKDRTLLMPQMIFAGFALIGALLIAPQVTFFLLSSIFVTALFGIVQFDVKQAIRAWIFIAVGTAIALGLNWNRLALPASTPAEVLLLWIILMLGLARFGVVTANMDSLRRKLRERNAQLEQSLARIQELADHDELTGVLNRRCFMQKLEEERARADRTGTAFCVALFDLDHFKQVNDRYGHLTGDKVLKAFCATVATTLRTTDRFGRFGGEEFAMLLTATPIEFAPTALDRIRAAFESRAWDGDAPGLQATVSVGVATYRPGDGVQTVLDEADRALYAAKNGGRNRVVVFREAALHAR